MKNLIARLEKRGWAKRDIKRAVTIISNAKKDKPMEIKSLEKKINWILLIVIIAANFAVSVALLPLLVVMRGIQLYLIIVILGVVFGLLFELVIRSIEHLEKHHNLFIAILIPLISLINFFAMAKFSNKVSSKLNLANSNNSFAIALVYAVSFVLPFIIYRFFLKIEYYARE